MNNLQLIGKIKNSNGKLAFVQALHERRKKWLVNIEKIPLLVKKQ